MKRALQCLLFAAVLEALPPLLADQTDCGTWSWPGVVEWNGSFRLKAVSQKVTQQQSSTPTGDYTINTTTGRLPDGRTTADIPGSIYMADRTNAAVFLPPGAADGNLEVLLHGLNTGPYRRAITTARG